jgi:hypothetical protein
MKAFCLVVPPSKGGKFEANVRRLLADCDRLESIVLPVIEAWRSLRVRAAELGRQLLVGARRSRAHPPVGVFDISRLTDKAPRRPFRADFGSADTDGRLCAWRVCEWRVRETLAQRRGSDTHADASGPEEQGFAAMFWTSG